MDRNKKKRDEMPRSVLAVPPMSLCQCRLLLDRVEIGVGEDLLDLLLDPEIRIK